MEKLNFITAKMRRIKYSVVAIICFISLSIQANKIDSTLYLPSSAAFSLDGWYSNNDKILLDDSLKPSKKAFSISPYTGICLGFGIMFSSMFLICSGVRKK